MISHSQAELARRANRARSSGEALLPRAQFFLLPSGEAAYGGASGRQKREG